MIPADKRGHGGSRKRPPLVLPALIVPEGISLEEWAVTIATAAELTGVKMQGLHAQIERGTLPAYLLDGRKMVRLDDLVECQAARRQQDAIHELDMRRASHQINVDNPISSAPMEDQCRGAYEDCEVCNLDLHARWDAEGLEPALVVERPKRTYSPERLAQLARARERAHAVNAETNAARARMRAADIAAVRARLGLANEA